MTQVPDFMRRAMEAQGKVDPDEVGRIAESIAADAADEISGEAVQETLPLEPICARCGGSREVWSYETEQSKPCPECT